LRKYLNWASDYAKAKMVVVRQMFDFDYPNNVKGMFISSEKVFKEMQISDYELNEQGNPVFKFKRMDVEIEYRTCACELNHPVMRADGNIYTGWSDKSYEQSDNQTD